MKQRSRAAAVALIVVALIGAIGVAGWSLRRLGRFSTVIEPTIKLSGSERGTQAITRDWQFEDGRARISVPIDRAVYAGAIAAEKSAITLGGARASDWVPDYYRAFISESHQEAFYSAMLEELHARRRTEGLDDARYVELVTTMVQGLEYRTDSIKLAPKFPIETFGDGFGDCDDKTLLAAALLSRDGYDVSILMFEPEQHVAMGIRAPGLDYKGTGYAYVELSDSSLVGVVPEELSGGKRLTSQPKVIRIGQGQLAYTAGQQIEYIQRRRTELSDAMRRVQTEITRDDARLTAEASALQAERKSLDGIIDPARLAAAGAAYNARVKAANDLTAQTNQKISRYNAMVDVERYVLEGSANRPQVYSRLQAIQL